MLTRVRSIPQDPEARALTVGVAVAADYAIAAWSNFLMWPAKEAPYCTRSAALIPRQEDLTDNIHADRHGWQAAVSLLSTAIVMTFLLRMVDARFLRYVFLPSHIPFPTSIILITTSRKRRTEFGATIEGQVTAATTLDTNESTTAEQRQSTDLKSPDKQVPDVAELEMALAK